MLALGATQVVGPIDPQHRAACPAHDADQKRLVAFPHADVGVTKGVGSVAPRLAPAHRTARPTAEPELVASASESGFGEGLVAHTGFIFRYNSCLMWW